MTVIIYSVGYNMLLGGAHRFYMFYVKEKIRINTPYLA
jgi:hypothetical protein